ncbi:MAG: hypothetical protein V2A54_10820 [Bacteroidota bacterium]
MSGGFQGNIYYKLKDFYYFDVHRIGSKDVNFGSGFNISIGFLPKKNHMLFLGFERSYEKYSYTDYPQSPWSISQNHYTTVSKNFRNTFVFLSYLKKWSLKNEKSGFLTGIKVGDYYKFISHANVAYHLGDSIVDEFSGNSRCKYSLHDHWESFLKFGRSFSLILGYEYALSNNWMVGVNLSYQYRRERPDAYRTNRNLTVFDIKLLYLL